MTSVAASAALILTGRVASALAGFAISVVLADRMSRGDLALFLIIQTAVFLIGIVTLLGFPQLMVHLVPKLLRDGRVSEAYEIQSTSLVACFLSSMLFFSCLAIVLYLGKALPPYASFCLVAWGTGVTLTTIAAEIARLNGRVVAFAVFSGQGVWGGPAIAILTLTALAVGDEGAVRLSYAIVSYSIASAAAGALALGFALRSGHLLKASFRRDLVGKAAVYMLVPLASVYPVTDIWLASLLVDATNVATYGIASRLSSMSAMPLTLLETIFAPFLSSGYHPKGGADLRRHVLLSARLAQIIGLSLICAAPFAWWFIETFYGSGFSAAGPALAILLAGRGVAALLGPVNSLLIASGLGASILRLQATGLVAAVVVGIAAYGPFGTAGVALGYALSFILVAYLSRRELLRRSGIDSAQVATMKRGKGARSAE